MTFVKCLAGTGLAFGLIGALAAAAATSHVVNQKDKAFSAKKLEIAVGDSVTFKNDDGVKHNILIKDIDFNSGMQDPGTDATASFGTAGKFKVRCGIHPKMKMTIVVQ